MDKTIKNALFATAAVAGLGLLTLPAYAMPVQHGQTAQTSLQLASWGDRVRGRTSSSTGEVGYGYGYGRGYPGYYPYGYGRAPYGYGRAPAEFEGGYGYGYGAY